MVHVGIAMIRCHLPNARLVDKTSLKQSGTLQSHNVSVTPVAMIQHTALYLRVVYKACSTDMLCNPMLMPESLQLPYPRPLQRSSFTIIP